MTDKSYQEGVIDGQRSMLLALAKGGVAVSNKMVKAAQDSYQEHRHPSYGLTNEDMRKAIKAAICQLGVR